MNSSSFILNTPRPDWFRLFTNLHEVGFNDADIAKHLHKNTTTVYRWKMGTEPKYSDGYRLIEMYRKITKTQ